MDLCKIVKQYVKKDGKLYPIKKAYVKHNGLLCEVKNKYIAAVGVHEDYFIWRDENEDILMGLTEKGKAAEAVIFPKRCMGTMGNIFFYNDNIKYVEFLYGIEEIYPQVCNYCRYLKEIVIPGSVKKIWDNAFLASGLMENVKIRIPKSVEEIGSAIFYYDNELGYAIPKIEVYYEGSESEWNNITIDSFHNERLLNAEMFYNC